ncbi:MAG: undecaprenyl-diphosphate phosphatase [Bacteroidia bacterium]
MTTAEAIILAVIEGLTEFLPVSSTGHMILASSAMHIASDPFTKLFTIAIQFGAILSVLVLYWRKFIQLTNFKFYIKLGIAVIPALIIGKLFGDRIDDALENPLFIACTLIGGGVILLFVDQWFKNQTIREESRITFVKAFFIGCWQILAVLLPGMSRSASTIIGGMQQRLTRELAAEFSFFLAVPTLLAATGYSLVLKKWEVSGVEMKGYELVMATPENTQAFIIGNIVAFVVAILAIKLFIGVVKRYGFRIWGIYRIVAGIAVLLTDYFIRRNAS